MPRFYHQSSTPPQIADLPLDALRSQLYPVDPNVPDRIAAQQGQPLPIGLPQRMAFRRFKSGAAAITATQAAQSYISARDFGDKHSGLLVSQAGIPPVIMTPASFATTNGATALKPVNIDPAIYEEPIAQGYLPPNRYIGVNQLNEFVRADATSKVLAQQTQALRASGALQEIADVRSAIAMKLGRR